MTHQFPRATADTGYYGVPLLKAPVWTWEIPLYLFVGGAAGAAGVIAAVTDWTDGDGTLARDARWVAAAGGPLSMALLTADLGRPERFINMLRVFKRQSAMSVGSWTLFAFSTTAAASAFAAEADRMLGGSAPIRIVAHASTATMGVFGTLMSTYTGVLIGATAIPVWNQNIRILPLHFGASGVASAVSILELIGHDDDALNALGFVAAAIETLTGAIVETKPSPAMAPLKAGASGWTTRAGGVLSGPVALTLRAAAVRNRSLRRPAAIAALVGSVLTRLGWLAAGRASAHDPSVPLQLPAATSMQTVG